MPSGDQGRGRPRAFGGDSPRKAQDPEPVLEEQGLDGDVDDGLDEGDADHPDGAEEASGPASAEPDADLGGLDEGEGHDDDRVGSAQGDVIDADFEEDDARDDDDARGPDDDDPRVMDELEGEGDEGDEAETEAGEDDDLEGAGEDDEDDDGGAEGIADEDPSDGIEEPPALDGAEGEGEGLDEPLPELEEPS